MKLIIHSGSPKTGSSYLQSCFVKNSKRLIKDNLLYPGVMSGEYTLDSNVDINGQLLTRLIIAGLQTGNLHSILSKHLNKLKELNADTVLISDETLCVLHSSIWSMLQEICDQLKIELLVIAYFRNPKTYYPSHWAQIVKNHGEIRSLRIFTEQDNLPIWRNILAMQKSVRNFFLFDYDTEKQGQGLLKSFYSALGYKTNEIEILPVEFINESLSLNALTALRMLTEEYGGLLTPKLYEVIALHDSTKIFPKPGLSEELNETVNLRHHSEYELCKKFYFLTLDALNQM